MSVTEVPQLRTASGEPVRRTRTSTRALGLLACAAVVVLLCFLSLAVGARVTQLSAVWDAVFHYDPADTDHLVIRELRLPRTILGVLVGAALGLAGCADAGRHPQPAGRPRHPRRQRRRRPRCRRDRHLRLRRRPRSSATSGSPSPARRWPRSWSTSSARSAAEGATPVKLALAGAALSAAFGAVTSALLLLDQADLRPVPVLGGRLAGRPGHRRRAADRPVPGRRLRCWPCAWVAALNTLAPRRGRRPRSGRATSSSPGSSPPPRWCCSAARRRPPAARSASSG